MRRKARSLVPAAVLGAAAVVLPFDLLWLVALIGLPAIGFLECRALGREPGAWPWCFARLGVFSLIVSAAWLAPLKHEDERRLPELPAATLTLGEMERATVFRVPAAFEPLSVTLPSRTPTLREAMKAVEAQTSLACRPYRCGSGMTVLWGGYVSLVDLEPASPRNPGTSPVVR